MIDLRTKSGNMYRCYDNISLETRIEEVKQARLNNDFVTCGSWAVDAHEVEAIFEYKVLSNLGGPESGTVDERFLDLIKSIDSARGNP